MVVGVVCAHGILLKLMDTWHVDNWDLKELSVFLQLLMHGMYGIYNFMWILKFDLQDK